MNQFDSIEDALIFCNKQPDPVACLHGIVNQAMVDKEYGFARELLEAGEEQHEYMVEITRTEPIIAYRTAVGVGPEHLSRRALSIKWQDAAGDIDFTQEKACEPAYEVAITTRI